MDKLHDHTKDTATGDVKLSDNKDLLVSKIIQRFTDRSRKDIIKWREALRKAEDNFAPNRYKLHDLYKDLGLDNHYQSQKQIRVLALACKSFNLSNTKTGEVDEEKTKFFKQRWFNQLIRLYSESIFTGTKVVELEIDKQNITVHDIPQKHIVPEFKIITKREGETSGLRYDAEVYKGQILQLGDDTNLGLLNSLAPLIIWKRNAQQAWAEFSDKFGSPYRSATTTARDNDTLDRIEQMLDEMGSSAYGLFPEGTTLDFNQVNTSDAFEVFDKQIDRCNSEISKAICGGTMLSDNGSSHSQSETQYKVFEHIIKADEMDFVSFVNESLSELLNINGFGLDNLVFEFDNSEKLSLKEQFEVVDKLSDKFDVPEEYITKTFGVPVTKKQTPAPVDPILQKKKTEPNVRDYLSSVYNDKCCGHENITNTSYPKILKEWHTRFLNLFRGVYDKKESEIPITQYLAYAKPLEDGLEKGFKDRLKEVEYNSPDHRKVALLQAHLFHFSAASTFQQLNQLSDLAKASKDFTEFKREATKLGNVVLSHLKTEYDTTVASAQNGANYLRAVDNKDVSDLMYQTIGDQRVRDKHKQYDGLVAPVDDKVWDRIYPPNGWNCRCEVIEIPKGSRKLSDTKKVTFEGVSKSFNKNSGKIDHIFESDHAYLKEFDDKFSRKRFGLPTPTKVLQEDLSKFSSIKKQDQKDYEKWWNSEVKKQSLDDNDIIYSNYFGINYRLRKEKLHKKFEDNKYKGQNRQGIALHVEEVLKKPDEVWGQRQKGRNKNRGEYILNYMKKYKDGFYVVVANTESNGLVEVITWFKLENTAQSVGEKLSGLPIYLKKR